MASTIPSYFDDLGSELVRASERGLPKPRRAPRPLSWLASHLAIALAGGAVLTGGAGAAALALRSSPSDGPTGTVSAGVPGPSSLKYDLSVVPSLKVGEPGWCTTLSVRRDQADGGFGGAGCGPAPMRGQQRLYEGFTELGNGAGRLTFALVGEGVAWAELNDGERRIPQRDDRLPAGWRIVIAHPDELDGPLWLFAVSGAPIDDSDSAARPAQSAVRTVEGSTPTEAPCAVDGLPRSEAIRSRWVGAFEATPRLMSPSLLACSQTLRRSGDQWNEVTVLVDTDRPGVAMPAPLAGGVETDGTVELLVYSPAYAEPDGKLAPIDPQEGAPGNRALAKRVCHAWVVARARTRDERESLLRAARLTNLPSETDTS